MQNLEFSAWRYNVWLGKKGDNEKIVVFDHPNQGDHFKLDFNI